MIIKHALGTLALFFILPFTIVRAALPSVTKSGRVLYSTATTSYLNLGTDDGLQLGANAEVSRNGRQLGSCQISQIADHTAACFGISAHPGDQIQVRVTPLEKPLFQQASLLTSLAENPLVQEQLAKASYPKVRYRGSGNSLSQTLLSPIEVEVGHNSWFPEDGGAFQEEQLQLTWREAQLGKSGFAGSFDSSTLIWPERPDETRFRPNSDVQFYLFEAEVSSRSSSRPLVISFGRVRPWYLPGFNLFDGTQVGWRDRQNHREIGVYAGLLPDIVTLAPSADRLMGGIYLSQDLEIQKNFFLHNELRSGLFSTPDSDLNADVEWLLSGRLGEWVDTNLNLRGLLYNANNSTPAISAFNVDIGLHPTSKFNLFGSLRYLDSATPETSFAVADGALHSDLRAAFEMVRYAQAVLFVGQALADSDLDRTYGGGEIILIGGAMRDKRLTIGYQEEVGWDDGRTFYLQPFVALSRHSNLVSRLWYSLDELPTESTEFVGALVDFNTALSSRINLGASIQSLVNPTELSETSWRGGIHLASQF